MKSIYSILRYVNNPLSRESIAFGLIVISNSRLFYKFSKEKISLINKLNPENSKLINFTIDNIAESLENSIVAKGELFPNSNLFDELYLNRLSNYNNGMIQFDKSVEVSIDFDDSFFMSFYDKYIAAGMALNRREKSKEKTNLEIKVEKEIYAPLKDRVHVNFKLNKEQIPSLFFDFHLDLLGLNGTIYSAKSIDINSGKATSEIVKEISEFESVNARIDDYAAQKFNADRDISKHYLIMDPYEGAKESFKELYNTLQENSGNYYDLVGSEDLKMIASEIKLKNAKKFLI